MNSQQLLRDGKLAETLQALQEEVRANPADAKRRAFLFQLLCVLGKWERAMTQLNVLSDMDGKAVAMATLYRPALQAEALRQEVFEGKRSPLVFGEPAEWVGLMVQASQLVGQGRLREAEPLRTRALEEAPAIAGTITLGGAPQSFEWIADADLRLGPILEAVIDGRYFWVPMQNIRQVEIEPPTDLRDAIWAAAVFTWTNGGKAAGLIPARYPGSTESDDPAIVLARKTEWVDHDGDFTTGLGQRMFATDQGEYPILETRSITLGADAADLQAAAASDGKAP